MKNLQIINQDGKLVTDSREVAEKVGKRHSDLLETINTYIKYLTDGKIRSLDFFIESGYVDGKGETRPCYLLTKQGCEMVANKMTGQKGVLFTAEYVQAFNKMEQFSNGSNILNQFKAEVTTLVDELVQEKLNQIEDKCSNYYRPSSFEKSNISRYIKQRLGILRADEEYESVKQRVLIKLGATKWEDIPIETLKVSLNIIDESIRIIKLDRPSQVSIFD